MRGRITYSKFFYLCPSENNTTRQMQTMRFYYGFYFYFFAFSRGAGGCRM